jgi:hypothetical protein
MPHVPAPVLVTLAGALFLTACIPPPAASEPQHQTLAVDQVAGYWALSEAGGVSRCQLSLANLIIEGVRPVLVERCSVPAIAEAKSWRATTSGFELLSVDGAVVMTFRRTAVDAFEEAAGRYRLTRAPLS